MPPRTLLASLLLVCFSLARTWASAEDDWWNPPHDPFFSDSVEVTYDPWEDPPSRTIRWFVRERDTRGRPLHASMFVSDPDGFQGEFYWTWTFDVEYPATPGSPFCPYLYSFYLTSNKDGKRSSGTLQTDWDSSARILTVHANNRPLLCEGSDSIEFDPQGRWIRKSTCSQGQLQTMGTDSSVTMETYALWRVQRRGFEDETQAAPRWMSEHSFSTSPRIALPWDSLTVLGPTSHPLGAAGQRGTSAPGREAIFTNFADSIRWDPQGHPLSFTRWYQSTPGEHPYVRDRSQEFQWDGNQRIRSILKNWNGDSLVEKSEKFFRYSWSEVGVERPGLAPRSLLIRTASGRVRIEIPDSEEVQVIWVSWDGCRKTLFSGRSPRALELDVPRIPGLLQIRSPSAAKVFRVLPF